MADNDWRSADEKSVADLVVEVSEKASLLVREEVELAKAEIEQKVKAIGRGAVVAAGAGFFVLLALIIAIEGAAWATLGTELTLTIGCLVALATSGTRVPAAEVMLG